MSQKQLLVEKKGDIATLTLNRPEKKNSLTPDLVDELIRAFAHLCTDETIRAVILRGAGGQAFCAGYDIGSLPTGRPDHRHEKSEILNPVEALFQTIVDFPFPVIALINGVAFGAGCELAVCCDIRVAADHIRMGMPPAKLGLVYPWHGLQRFIQVIGLKGTKEMFFTGRAYDADRLKEIGLVDYLIPEDTLESFAFAMAEEIAANAPLALKGTKRALNLLLRAPLLDNDNLTEADLLSMSSFHSEDLKEGQQAFLEKRKPRFKGR